MLRAGQVRRECRRMWSEPSSSTSSVKTANSVTRRQGSSMSAPNHGHRASSSVAMGSGLMGSRWDPPPPAHQRGDGRGDQPHRRTRRCRRRAPVQDWHGEGGRNSRSSMASAKQTPSPWQRATRLPDKGYWMFCDHVAGTLGAMTRQIHLVPAERIDRSPGCDERRMKRRYGIRGGVWRG